MTTCHEASLGDDVLGPWARQERLVRSRIRPGAGIQLEPDGLVLWRSRSGRIVGVLELDARRTTHPRTFTIFVAPRWRRRGIATRLFEAARQRWHLDLAAQRYTPAGAAWANSLERHEVSPRA